jgi:predicted ATPase
MNTPGLRIITGAPGSGKTAILDRLRSDVRCVDEPAREILSEQRSAGGDGVPDRDPSLFVDLLLQRSIDKHQAAEALEGTAAFDRGVPDCVAYATILGTDPAPSIRACDVYRYHPEVFVLAPWDEIYVVDDERTMSFADTLPFHAAILSAYRGAGYTLVEVPRGSAEQRSDFVRGRIMSS